MNKEKILRKSEDFSKIIKQNQSYKSKYFSIYYQKSDKTLYGITIPKKVGKAHVRNKLKRQLKNIILINEKDIQTNINYVIIIRELAVNLSYEELQKEFMNLIKKVRI